MRYILYLLLLCLLVPTIDGADWSFTISGDDTADVDDADLWSTSSTLLRGDTSTTMWVGTNSGERCGWVHFVNLDDSLATYPGVVDSILLIAAIGAGEPLIDTTGDDDSLWLLVSPVRKIPVEAEVSWDTCNSGEEWTTAGAKDISDAYQTALDTTGPIVFEDYSSLDTVHLWVDPQSLLNSNNGWIIRPLCEGDGNIQVVFATSEDGNPGFSLVVYGHTEAIVSATTDTVSYSYNDAGFTTVWSTTGTTGRLGETGMGDWYKSCIRFTSINVDTNATVDSAFIYVTGGGLGSGFGSIYARIYAVNVGDADPFTTAVFYDSLLTNHKTSAYVNWTTDFNWSPTGSNKSPDIKTVVQEVFDRPDWVMSNALAFLFAANGTTTTNGEYVVYKTYDGSASTAPSLVLYLTNPVTGRSTIIRINAG